jgi:hypothetical protein
MPGSIKTAISIEEELFKKVNLLADKLHVSRSKLFAMAVLDFIKKMRIKFYFLKLTVHLVIILIQRKSIFIIQCGVNRPKPLRKSHGNNPMMRYSILLLLLVISTLSHSSAQVAGDEIKYPSPHGLTEKCVTLNHIPGGNYSRQDTQIEQQYCRMDIYTNTALCPKTWSTSPGTEFYPLQGSSYSSGNNNSVSYSDISRFERRHCSRQKHLHVKPVTFKNTINMKDTSATFSTASLLYYHFSRYFDTQIKVPVAVLRSMDKEVHKTRVTQPGIKYSRGRGMINNAWKDMLAIENSPATYRPMNEIFTADRKQIYGVLLRSEGERYNSVINGSRQHGWGEGQSRDFQETPAFLALRSEKPLLEAIDEGISKARNNHKLSTALGNHPSAEQMVSWMQDLTEITLLDYIFSQQDRIGNIDYKMIWMWQEDGEIKTARGKPGAATSKAIPVKQTYLNDNDAAGRYQYANYTKKTRMLEKIRHYNPQTYQLLLRMDKDFAQQGTLYQYLHNTFGLSSKQKKMIIKNIHQAASILRFTCQAGKLHFDLNAEQFFLTGEVMAENVNCN